MPMKYIKQILIILAVSFAGELLSYLIPLPIPASIYGIFLMFFSLLSGLIPHSAVKDVGHFLVDTMPLFLIPAAVKLLDAWELIRTSWWVYLLITFVSTVLVMGTVGRTAQLFTRRRRRDD